MVIIRSNTELINSAIEFYRMARNQLDIKPGTVARDLLIDGPSTQQALLYEELARISDAQSLRLSVGRDLDRLASNFGTVRKQGTTASGITLLTFAELEADFGLTSGDLVIANNGASFAIVNSQTVKVANANNYRATASQYQSDLDFVGITDEFAIEVLVEATVTGNVGNIPKYSIISTTIPNISNVTNAASFSGGSNAETDAALRNRVLSRFSGANTGTEAGYRNTVLADPDVIDAIVVGPGDDLMTRDGTQTVTLEDGTIVVVQEGTGGKVDIYAYGFRLVEILDSYIYREQSNQDDPTNSANDFVLGQIEADEDKTVTRKRLDDLESGILPSQPVSNIIEVTGSSSGANFQPKQVDDLGRITGNYELIRDTGAYGGSPWGFDKLSWISDRISDFSEDKSKGKFNGQDGLSFSDTLQINAAKQNIQITNENSRVSASDRTSIQLAHSPITSVTRVFNLTTGERYVVANQNPDGEGTQNVTGRIVISGSTLPAVSDTLQVDYTWVFEYDPNFDFDNLVTSDNPRFVLDSVDWGYSNSVSREESVIQAVGTAGTQFAVTVTHPITSVININTFDSDTSVVQLVSNRLAVIVTKEVSNVISIVRNSDDAELWNTGRSDGSFSAYTIFLPTDTVGEVGNSVSIRFNADDVYTIEGVSGSFSDNIITLSSSATVVAGTLVECNYIANVRNILPSTLLPNLPALRNGNGFNTSVATGVGNQPVTNIYSSPDVVEVNLRKAPSRLQLAVAGAISPGVFTVTGTTFTGIFDVVFKVANAGLTFDLSSVIKEFLDISSSSSVPSNVSLVRFISAEKVRTTSSLDVLEVEHTYDVTGYGIWNDSFVKREAVQDTSLSRTEISLPETPDNTSNSLNTGDKIRVTFYIATTNDTDIVAFSKSGSQYTDKIFALVDTVAISSGFTSGTSQTATLTILNQNQPVAGARYTVTQDYLAPKVNERISIRYNHNQVITDSTLQVENTRPVGADVLVKAATPLLVDLTMAIVVTSAYRNSSTIVAQNVRDAIATALTASSLGTTIDESDFISVAYTVTGVDRVRPIAFNLADVGGRVLSLTAGENEYFQADTVTITVEER